MTSILRELCLSPSASAVFTTIRICVAVFFAFLFALNPVSAQTWPAGFGQSRGDFGKRQARRAGDRDPQAAGDHPASHQHRHALAGAESLRATILGSPAAFFPRFPAGSPGRVRMEENQPVKGGLWPTIAAAPGMVG